MHSFTRVAVAALLAAPLATAAGQSSPAPQRFAYVDSRYILSNAPGTPVAQAALQRDVTAAESQTKRMSDSLDALTGAFTKEQAALTPEKRDARIKAINDRQGQYQQRYQALQQQLQDREAELMQPILDQIKLALEDVRTELGYTMIFDISQSPVIVAADKNLNVSDRVIAKLRTMPIPTIADRATGAGKATDSKAPAGKVPPGPVATPAGVRGPGALSPGGAAAKGDSSGKADSSATKKADSTATKKPDSTATKKPDSTATKKPPTP
jgi:outer membrane protein